VVWQTTGWTPLHIASEKGHVECVRALLDGGVAINQASVGCVKLDGTALPRAVWVPTTGMHVQLVVCAGTRRG
jgi:ankyrin repeat protein